MGPNRHEELRGMHPRGGSIPGRVRPGDDAAANGIPPGRNRVEGPSGASVDWEDPADDLRLAGTRSDG